VAGRLPRAPDEIALGDRTREELGVEVGDRLRAEGGDARVVGITVLPRFQAIGGADEAALNRGAVFTLGGLHERSTDFYVRWFLVRLKPGTARGPAIERLLDAIPPPYAFDVAPVAVPEDIEALDRASGTPIVLAALLAVLALATLIHALVTSVRRRRRDLAILVALGFTRRQLRAQVATTVAWHASVVAMFAVLVAVPVGIALGRWLSGILTDELGALPDLVVPVGTIAIIVAAAIVLANVVAFVPGRLAARLQPAAVLRTQ
jgi:hypothetical protein